MTDERPPGEGVDTPATDIAGGTVIDRPPLPPTPPGGTVPPALPPTPPARRVLWMTMAIGAAALLLGVWLVIAKLPRFLASPPPGGGASASTSSGGPAGPAAEARRIRATLFYVADDGSELVPVSREVLYGSTPAEQARRIVEAQIEAPPDGKKSAIPAGTTVRTVFLGREGEAYIDLSGAIVSGHSGGTLNEALTVFAIVNAVTFNLPDVTAVQILVNGKEVDTLAGHLDLRAPLAKGLEWVRRGQ